MKGFGLLISAGEWAGFHFFLGKKYHCPRIVLGYIAFTFFPFDGDHILTWAAANIEIVRKKAEEKYDRVS